MLGKRNKNSDTGSPNKCSKLSLNDCIGSKKFVAYKSNPSCFVCTVLSTIAIDKDRNLNSFGKNKRGAIGHENNIIIKTPKQISTVKYIKMVDCSDTTACIDFDGYLFTFGSNSYGQLGVGKDEKTLPFTNIPQRVLDIPPIDYISCGHSFTTCISRDRNLYSFGYNKDGQLGVGTNNSYSSPQLISDLNDIEIMQCGGFYTICKTYSNEYYSWGQNAVSQLGQGNNESCNKPIKCSNWPENIIDIKIGCDHTLLLTSSGYVYTFGKNEYGRLGLNDVNIKSINIPTLIKDIPLIKRIGCGYDHSMCIDINDNLWVFGSNDNGQLGLGDNVDRFKPILNELLHDIIDISSGNGPTTFVKTIKNEIYAFGNNEYSQLGTETEEKYQLTPIQVFKDNEDIWGTNAITRKQKSARK